MSATFVFPRYSITSCLSGAANPCHFINDGLFLTAIETQGLHHQNAVQRWSLSQLITFSDQLFSDSFQKSCLQRDRHLR
jgi:H+/gluconate symporter-like permease